MMQHIQNATIPLSTFPSSHDADLTVRTVLHLISLRVPVDLEKKLALVPLPMGEP